MPLYKGVSTREVFSDDLPCTANSPIFVTLLGIITDFKFLHFRNPYTLTINHIEINYAFQNLQIQTITFIAKNIINSSFASS
jgi:hypothetical protein